MSTEQQVLRKEIARTHLTVQAVPRLSAFAVAPVRLAVRLLMGSGRGPRGYRREGFPEHEMHQVISGRIDRFRGM